MSRTASATNAKAATGGFDPTPYVREGITVDEVLEIKTAFDLFDADKGGMIEPKGNYSLIQKSKILWTHSD